MGDIRCFSLVKGLVEGRMSGGSAENLSDRFIDLNKRMEIEKKRQQTQLTPALKTTNIKMSSLFVVNLATRVSWLK